MRAIVVVSHTYVEAENRGKLRALAASAPVTAVVPHRWRADALGHTWSLSATTRDGGVTVAPVRWTGPFHPSLGVMRVPGSLVGPTDILQIEEEPWTPTAFLAARRRSAATVLFTWENAPRRLPPPWRWMERATFARIDGLIAGSTGAADEARRRGYAGPVDVIPQLGVDPVEPARRDTAGPLRVAYVGRLVPEKGVDLLLQALAHIDAPLHLQVVGEGPDRTRLERLAGALGVTDRVAFLGAWPHERVAALWPQTDVLVLPSRTTPGWREQLGHVLLEAMAHGVPVVGSTCGAIPEVIGKAGLVFPEGVSDALAAHLLRLASDAGTRERLSDAARARVASEYTNARLAARTRAFHDDVLAAR